VARLELETSSRRDDMSIIRLMADMSLATFEAAAPPENALEFH
jgi:hypothetical protein